MVESQEIANSLGVNLCDGEIRVTSGQNLAQCRFESGTIRA
jgi:hypothetical protein